MIEIPNNSAKTPAEIWTELVERTQNTTNSGVSFPSRQLDFEILYALGKGGRTRTMTGSYEAADQFVQDELPGWSHRLQCNAESPLSHRYVAVLMEPPSDHDASITDGRSWSRHHEGRGHTAALALISAFCRMKAKDDKP